MACRPESEETSQEFPVVPLPGELHGQLLILPAMKYNMYKLLPMRDAHLNHDVQSFYWKLVIQLQSTHMTDLGHSVFSPSRCQTDTTWLRIPGEQKQTFTKNHNVRETI